ncbi:reverse transcriptase domain-containing protein [Tanacetum coccineum]
MSDKTTCLNDLSYIPPNNEQNKPTQGDIGETSNKLTQDKCNEFEELYVSANKDLYPGCDFVIRLDFMAKFTHFKVKANPRNIRLGLAVDGFNSFENLSQSYSMWLVILTIYNLSLRLCMKESSLMLMLLIPGPKSPGKDIDVYLRPLIDDLKDLWVLKGVKTIDVDTGQTFNMKAMLLWTINSFSARSSLSAGVGKADMVKGQSQLVDILCNLEQIYPPAFFDVMIHLVIYLPQEALEGGTVPNRWMYPFVRYMKKQKNYVREKKPEGLIVKGYVAEAALTFSSHYFRDVTTKFNRPDRNVDCPPPTYKDPGVSASGELFALAYGPTSTPIPVNSCVVNGVRFVVHNRDERRITQNNGICSPDGQSIDVDATSDIIDVDEDGDFVDDEDVVPHDLADSNDEVLATDDDDDVVGMPKTQQGRQESRQTGDQRETRNLGLRKLTNEYGPQKIRVPDVLPFLAQNQGGEEGEGVGNPSIGIRRLTIGLILRTLPDAFKMLKTEQRARSSARRDPDGELRDSRVPVPHPDLLRHTVDGVFAQDETRVQHEEMIRLRDLGDNTPTGVPYTKDQITTMVRNGKQRGHILGVGRVLVEQGSDAISINEPRCIDEVKEDNKQLRKELAMLKTVIRSGDRMSQLLTQLELQHEVDGGSGSGGDGMMSRAWMRTPTGMRRGKAAIAVVM